MLRILFLFSLLAVCPAYSTIYEQCKWSNQSLTDRFIKFNQEFLETSPPSDPSCDTAVFNDQDSLSSVDDVLETEPFNFGGVPPMCFLSSAIRGSAIRSPSEYGSRKEYYYCSSPNNKNPTRTMPVRNPQTGKIQSLYLRSPCISEDYHQSLVKTFNKMTHCFGLSHREARNLFAIINHESQFVPNAQSPTGARCSGQLTKDTVDDLNINILQNMYPEFHTYQSASNKCPSLVYKTIPPNLHCSHPGACPREVQRGSWESKQKKLAEYPKTCKLSSDMSQCFFYTFLNFKNNLEEFKQTFRHDREFGRGDAVEERFTDMYGGGLNPNEMILAKGDGREHLFASARAAYEEVQKHEGQPNNPMYALDVKTIPLISEEDMDQFKFFSAQLSYNGGSDVVKNQVRNFLSFLKQEIRLADCSSSNNNYCKYRKKFLKGESLDLASVKEDFIKFLRQARFRTGKLKGKLIYTREETFSYPKKIQEDMDYFQNSDGLARGHLKSIAPDASPEEIQETLENIKSQCKFPIL